MGLALEYEIGFIFTYEVLGMIVGTVDVIEVEKFEEQGVKLHDTPLEGILRPSRCSVVTGVEL